MSDGKTIQKADWFPGTPEEWDVWIGPAVEDGIIKSGDAKLYAVPEDVNDAGQVRDFFSSFIRDDSWLECAGGVN